MDIELIQTIATGTGSALTLSVVGLSFLWKKLDKKDEQMKALSDSVAHALIKDAESRAEHSEVLRGLKTEVKKSGEISTRLLTKIEVLFSHDDFKGK